MADLAVAARTGEMLLPWTSSRRSQLSCVCRAVNVRPEWCHLHDLQNVGRTRLIAAQLNDCRRLQTRRPALTTVSMGGNAILARSAEAAESANMGAGAVGARSVEGQASVSTGGSALNARNVEGRGEVSVSTRGSAISARSEECGGGSI